MKYQAALLLLSAIATIAQEKIVDPGGWTKAKWGMTETQIKDAFPEAKYIAVFGTPYLGSSTIRSGV